MIEDAAMKFDGMDGDCRLLALMARHGMQPA